MLPLQAVNEEETAVDFAGRVQGLIAESLSVEATQFTAAEAREYIKKLKTPPRRGKRASCGGWISCQ